MSGRINTIMQTCFCTSGVLPKRCDQTDQKAIEKTYFKKGPKVIEQNFKAVDATLAHLYEVSHPAAVSASGNVDLLTVSDKAPAFVKEVTAMMMSGHGDNIPLVKWLLTEHIPAVPLNGKKKYCRLSACLGTWYLHTMW